MGETIKPPAITSVGARGTDSPFRHEASRARRACWSDTQLIHRPIQVAFRRMD